MLSKADREFLDNIETEAWNYSNSISSSNAWRRIVSICKSLYVDATNAELKLKQTEGILRDFIDDKDGVAKARAFQRDQDARLLEEIARNERLSEQSRHALIFAAQFIRDDKLLNELSSHQSPQPI